MRAGRITLGMTAVLVAATGWLQADDNVQYLIGLRGAPANPLLRQSHDLEPGQGLLVRDVMLSGPASSAGMRVGDVVLSVGGKPIGTTAELQSAVQKAGEAKQNVKLEVIGINGDQRTVEIKPMDRRQVSPLQLAAGEGDTAKKILELLRNLDIEDLEEFDLGALGKLAEEFEFRVPNEGQPGRRDPLTLEGRVRLGDLIQGLLQPAVDESRVKQLESRIEKLEATVAELTRQLDAARRQNGESVEKPTPKKKRNRKKKDDASPSDSAA